MALFLLNAGAVGMSYYGLSAVNPGSVRDAARFIKTTELNT